VLAVPGDLRREISLRAGHQRGDPAVLPAPLGFAAGSDRAEQPERLVVIEDLPEYRPGRKHPRYLRCMSSYTERDAGQGEMSSHKAGDLDVGGSEGRRAPTWWDAGNPR